MNTATQAAITGAAQAAVVLAPIDPRAAALVSLAPVALQLLDTMTKMQNAETLTVDDIAATFKMIGQNIQSVHDQWVAENAK